MSDAFEDIFNQGGDDAGYYTDAAMQYLNEIDDLKEKFEDCYSKYLKNKHELNMLNEVVGSYQQQIQNLKVALQHRNGQIEGLLKRLEYYEGSNIRLATAEIVKRVSALSSQIRTYIEHYKKTGKFDRIDEVISNVRSLFNMALVELNVLNSENQEIGGILKTLISLEVKYSKFYSVSLLKLNLQNSERILRGTRRELTSKNPLIVVSSPIS